MKKPSRIRIRMGADGAPRVSLGESTASGKSVAKRKVVSFHKGRAEQAPETPQKSGRIRVRMR